MNKLDRQEQDPRIRALQRLARRVVPPARSEEEWEQLEHAVFDRLDRQPRPWVARPVQWLVRPRVAVVAAAWVCLALVVVYGVRRVLPPGAGAVTRLSLRVDGVVEVCVRPGARDEANCPWQALEAASQVVAGCRIRTLGEASVAAVLDTGTGFVLGDSGLVRIAALGTRQQHYELDRGTIRVYLRRRGQQGQSLVVTTANAVCEAVGTVFTVRATQDSQPVTSLTVENGTVRIAARRVAEQTRVVTAPASVRLVGDLFEQGLAMAPPESAQADTGRAPVAAPDTPLIVPEPLGPALPPLPLPDISVSLEPGLQPGPQAPGSPPLQVVEDSAGSADVAARYVDSAYLAGQVAGRNLFWRYDLVPLDTLGWAEAVSPEVPDIGPGEKGPRASSARAAAAGVRFVEVVEPTALSVALLQQTGCAVVFRTQWSVSVRIGDSLDNRTRIEGERAFSDHLWERLDRAVVTKAARVKGGDFRVQLQFRRAGHSEFDGRTSLVLAQVPLAGTEGATLRRAGRRIVAGNVTRQFGACYAIVSAGKRLDAVVREIEGRMDAYGLDISYRAPLLREVR